MPTDDLLSLKFNWREVESRPKIEVVVAPVQYALWHTFAKFHYLNADLSRAARCFALFVNEEPAAFAATLHFPHATVKNLKRFSRNVTLPDWQGLGLMFVLIEAIAASYKANGFRIRNYPAHPAFVRAHDRSSRWSLKKKPGTFQATVGRTSTIANMAKSRPCAIFEYVGDADPELKGLTK